MWQIRIYDRNHFWDDNYDLMELVKEVEVEPEFGETFEINGKTYRCCGKSLQAKVLGVEEITINQEPDEECGDELICPYCGHEQGDAWELSADSDKMECGSCGSEIEYEREYSVSYTVKPVKMCDVVKL
ncbi:hypothetical protein [Paenibacillus sp. P46E]|uniref:hypothetical protein n=1 Tax=Paenibacillus sp. P46E TaxID=1349436 RepID=UPI00093986A1|nr:hypothetical protein [Paenibacillus sp. P46E]OKP95077.1 hypothetical protein A3849_27740 [Paenibacillus sp. P46E]